MYYDGASENNWYDQITILNIDHQFLIQINFPSDESIEVTDITYNRTDLERYQSNDISPN